MEKDLEYFKKSVELVCNLFVILSICNLLMIGFNVALIVMWMPF